MRQDLPEPVLTLIAAARRALGSSPCSDPPRTTAAPHTFTEYALRHGMAAWVPNLVAHEALLAHMARSLQAVRQLLDITDAFDGSGIPVVVLKGPVFSQWLYGDAAARRFSDLDLLVSADTRDAARRLLERRGFQRQIPAAPGDVVYASLGAWPMVHPTLLQVDLHWSLAGRRYPQPLDPADVLRSAIDVPLGHRAVHAPCPEHASILALTHASKHLWYALELPFSIAALVRRKDVDWQAVRDLAVGAGTLRGAAAGVALASDLFGVEVPAPFRTDAELADVVRLRGDALVTLALPPGQFAERTLERRMHVLAFDRTADRLAYDVRRLIEPTRAEWEWISLPTGLTRLYWPARLVRLAWSAIAR